MGTHIPTPLGPDKRLSLDEAAALIRDGETLALGGMTLYRRPAAFARALARRPVRTLTLISFTAGYECDLGFHDGRMAVDSLHPGVTLARVQEATGFPLAMVSPPAETPPPTVDELELIRETIDPLGIRELERLPRRERQQQLWHIVQMEAAGGLHRRVV